MAYESITTEDGFTVSSNTATAEAMTATFAPAETTPDDTPDPAPVDGDESAGADVPAVDSAGAAAAAAVPIDPLLEQNEDGSFKTKAKKGSAAELKQRIAKATWEREEAKRETEQLKSRLQAFEAAQTKPAVTEPLKPVAASADDPEPTVDQFDTYEKFVKAQARWEARQEVRAFQQTVEQRAAETIQQQAITRVEVAGTAVYPDFKEKLSALVASGLTFPRVLTDAILDPDNPSGFALAYEYATHPDDLRRLSALAPEKAAFVIGKTLARIDVPHSGSTSAPVLSQANTPIQPVGNSPSADADEASDDEPLERHILRYNAADRKAGRR